MGIQGTETEKNLMAAFAGESQARNRYTYAAGKARKDGYRQISEVFAETADQESEHAKRLFKLMEGGEIEITGGFPAGPLGTTLENLRAAAGGENHEWTSMYPGFAAKAREEGFDVVALVFDSIAIAEKQHEKRFKGLADSLEAGKVFVKDSPAVWRCMNCGYIAEGTEAPKACPACAHSQAHFELLAENW